MLVYEALEPLVVHDVGYCCDVQDLDGPGGFEMIS